MLDRNMCSMDIFFKIGKKEKGFYNSSLRRIHVLRCSYSRITMYKKHGLQENGNE